MIIGDTRMQVMYERCCGVDVHKRSLVACLRVGKKQEIRQYGTTSQDLRDFTKWLAENDCQIVAMESTGSYWKPVYNCLELLGLEIMVVNAQHMKTVPGRKTDVKDSEWIADLLMHGLLKGSYIPDREQRELREITRYRKSLVEERSREKNRLEKILEGANIKLSSVVSDLAGGVTSRHLLTALIGKGVDNDNIDDMLYGRLKDKREELLAACDGFLTKTQKYLVSNILSHIDDMTRRIDGMDDFIDTKMEEYDEAIKELDEIPGIGAESAKIILAEIGLDMSRFPSAAHLASWAGLSPGNNESAGKRKSGRTTKGNKTLKTTMIQCAQAAKRVKNSFYKAQFERLAPRRGNHRATVAVAHSMLISIYHMLKNHSSFIDLGAEYYHQFDRERKVEYLLKRAESLGWRRPTLVTT